MSPFESLVHLGLDALAVIRVNPFEPVLILQRRVVVRKAVETHVGPGNRHGVGAEVPVPDADGGGALGQRQAQFAVAQRALRVDPGGDVLYQGDEVLRQAIGVAYQRRK